MIKPSLGLIGVLSTLVVAVLAAGFVPAIVDAAPGEAGVTVSASDDTYVRPSLTGSAGESGALVVGGSDAAVTYLKFSVTSMPEGSGPLSVALVMTPVRLAGASAATSIDVHSVADTSWSEDTLTNEDAPALGPVVASSTLSASAVTVRFDLTAAAGRTGVFAFALTAASGEPERLFVSTEGGGASGGPHLSLLRGGGPTPPPTGPPTSPPTSPPVTPTPPPTGGCTVGAKLVPSCGVLLGVAPSARTDQDRSDALTSFENEVGTKTPIYHAYHRGIGSMFPSAEEIGIARESGDPHILFINWKPQVASWNSIANGNARVDAYLDKLAAYIKANYTDPFYFTIHHEPENDVIERPGSGYTAADYAKMYRHVVLRLRGDGVTNLVTVMDYMAFAPWNVEPWFNQLYPGDDVVDWVGWDMYGYSQPKAYGYGDFAEMLTRGSGVGWPGIYTWAATRFPNKPLMVAEWGVWYNSADANHQAAVFGSVGSELQKYPQIKALVYFDTPSATGRSSLISTTPSALAAYQSMSKLPIFQVAQSPPHP